MNTERYPHAVAAYRQENGWETSGTRVEDDVVAIVARRNGTDSEQRQVTLVVANPDATVERKHLKFLLKAAKKKDADKACVTTQGSLSETARAITEEYDIAVLDSETVVTAVSDGSEQSNEESGPPQREQTDTAASGQERHQPQAQHDRQARRDQQARDDQQVQQNQQPQYDQQAQHDQRGQQARQTPQQSQPQQRQQPQSRPRRQTQHTQVDQYVDQLRNFELPDDSGERLRQAVGTAPLVKGGLRGVGVYVTALVFAAFLHALVTGAQIDAIFVPAGDPGVTSAVGGDGFLRSAPTGTQFPGAVVEGAWLLYSAQGVDIVGTTLPVEGNLITAAIEGNINDAVARQYRIGFANSRPGSVAELGQLFVGFRLLYLVVPFLLFTEAYRVVGAAYESSDSLLDQAVGGASLLAGYLPLAVAGALVFTRSAAPGLGGALVMAGVVQPVLYGGAGGVAAGVLRGRDARLRQGGYYGVVAGVIAILGTFVLTFFSGTGLGIMEAVVATLTLFPHAAGLAVPVGERVPSGLLYYLVVAGSLAVVSRILVRNYRRSGRPVDAALKASTLAMGFGACLFAALFVVLVGVVSFNVGIFGNAMGAPGLGLTAEAAIPIRPVRIVFVGGVVVPAIVGGGVAAYLAQE